VAELVGKGRARWIPAEFGTCLGRLGVLIEQLDFGEILAQTRPGLSSAPRRNFAPDSVIRTWTDYKTVSPE